MGGNGARGAYASQLGWRSRETYARLFGGGASSNLPLARYEVSSSWEGRGGRQGIARELLTNCARIARRFARRVARRVAHLAARRHPPLDEPVGGQQLEAGAAAERDQPPALARRLIRVD